MDIVHVVGARPNFMKAAPVMAALDAVPGVTQKLVHTGQHYDARMSRIFFEELGLPEPDLNLNVGSGSHAVQTAQILVRFEETVLTMRPDLVLVYGDVNSTMTATLVCAKLHIPVGHVEAGLRSRDRTMPEEINRLVTDQLAALLFTPSSDGDANLAAEGVPAERIHLVGNVIIDTVKRLLPQALERWESLSADLGLDRYGLVTLHRPSNVDEPMMLQAIMETLGAVSEQLPLLFPIHPRTRERLRTLDTTPPPPTFRLVEPVGYLDFLALQRHATLLITDSGGIQEETTYLGIPCLTVRENTERPITCDEGTNILVGRDMARLTKEFERILNGGAKAGAVPALWDGKAGERIAAIIQNIANRGSKEEEG